MNGASVAFLRELLRSNPEANGGEVLAKAGQVAAQWAQAVGGGDSRLFGRRLAWEGFPQREELLRQLSAGFRAQGEETAPLPVPLAHLVPAEASLQEAAESLASWAGERVSRVWPRAWWVQLGSSFRQACQEHLQRFLALAAGGEVPFWELLEARPVVARWLCQRTEEWVKQAQRLACRFFRDRRQLAAAFGWLGVFSVPMAISWSRSDWHQGETVLHLQFPQGLGVYYKPRSLQPEVVLAQWFEAFRSVGVPVAPLPPMVAKKGYGWMQEVPRARLESRQEVRAWFYSAGALLAAAWILGLRDLHWENVVAGWEGPVVVDGECWAQPLGQEEEAADSALASGLLTMPSPGPGSFREDGALLGGTDPRAQSLPLWRGRPAPVEAFAQELLAGFEESLQRLAKAVKEGGPWSQCWAELRGLAVRWVPRPSEAYAQLLSWLLGSPKVREGWQANLVTEVLLRPLVASQEKKPSWWSWAQEEQEALLRLSVPRLTLSTGRRGGLFRLSGRQAISRRLARLSEAVIQKQKQAVGAAFPPKASSQDQEAFFRQQAHQVAQELLAQKPPAHLDLACGLAGKALAWAAWARVSSDTEAFRQAMAFYQRLREALPRPWPGPLGLCRGLGGVVYSLTAGAALLGEGAWAEEAFHLLETADFPATGVWDVEGGLAGLLLGSWALAAGKPQLREKLVRGAHALWQMLPKGDQGPAGNGQLAGFAHGFSGVAAALALVGEVAGVQELKEKAWVLLAREPKKGPWLAPGRTSSGTHLPVPLQGWCHGAPGVYLARLLALPLAGPEALLAQKQEALTILLQAPLFGASSLCCGSIARSEILLIGAQREGRSELLQQAKTRTGLFCRLRPWRGKLPEEGGLFAGLEGLLFHLSRLLAPEEVGSVLFGQIPGRG